MINEEKKSIVIGNYFDVDCDVDTTIREAYELGFDRGIQKAAPVVRRDVLKQVLEIIDGSTAYAKELDETFADKADGMMAATSAIRNAVLALKGGEQE